MAEKERANLHAMSTICARCRAKVGLIWFKGHSTLFDGPIDTDGAGNLVVRMHRCPEVTTSPTPSPRHTRRRP